MLPSLKNLLRDICSKFLKTSVIVACSEITDIDYRSKENHKDHSQLFIGSETKKFISEHRETKFDLNKFYKDVLAFYISAVDYMLQKLPFKSELLHHIKVADLSNREASNFENLEYFLQKFPCLLSQNGGFSKDTLESEFLKYQSFPLTQEIVQCKEIDTAWFNISQVKGFDDKYLFANLARVMLSLLTIFHSNADCERIFSIVGKNINEYRSNMSVGTLDKLLLRKVAADGPCYSHQFDEKLVKAAKSATYNDLCAGKK